MATYADKHSKIKWSERGPNLSSTDIFKRDGRFIYNYM